MIELLLVPLVGFAVGLAVSRVHREQLRGTLALLIGLAPTGLTILAMVLMSGAPAPAPGEPHSPDAGAYELLGVMFLAVAALIWAVIFPIGYVVGRRAVRAAEQRAISPPQPSS